MLTLSIAQITCEFIYFTLLVYQVRLFFRDSQIISDLFACEHWLQLLINFRFEVAELSANTSSRVWNVQPRWHEPRWHEPPWHEPRWHEPPWHEPPWHQPRWHEHRGMNHDDMNHRDINHDGMNHRGMNHDGMNHRDINHDGMNHRGMNHDGMNHRGMNHNGMNHCGMNHDGMNHRDMNHDGLNRDGMIDHCGMNDCFAGTKRQKYGNAVRALQTTRTLCRRETQLRDLLLGCIRFEPWLSFSCPFARWDN